MSGDSSSTLDQPAVSRPTIRPGHASFLQSCTLSVWMGASGAGVDRWLFEAVSYSSPPSTTSHESAATTWNESHELEAEVDGLLGLAADEGFEDGMENRTSRSINFFVSKHSVAGVRQLANRLQSERMNQRVAADIVRMLGQIEHAPSHDDRVYIAECLLYSALPLARDAGAVALGDLADERCIPELQAAIDAESIPALKADMQGSLRELMKGPEHRP